MKRFKTMILAMLVAISVPMAAQTQIGGIVEFNKLSHNFGDVLLSDGPISCSFTVKNISSKPVAIQSVVASCGCTDVDWTREPIKPGKTGTISATYTNDEGPYPFNKDLTVYISGVKRPVILKFSGTSYRKPEPLDQAYPVHFGTFGVKETQMKVGNVEQGGSVTEEITVANFGKSPVKVEFKDLSPNLKITLSPVTIPAGKTATMSVTVTADRKLWGKNHYYATPVVGGKAYGGKLDFWAITKENFEGLTKEQKDAAPKPMFTTSSFGYGIVKAGKQIDATFTLTNNGKSDFRVYSVDTDNPKATYGAFPVVKAGGKASFKVHLDTTGMPKGENLVILTLITNSPSRPIINLFLTGEIQ